MVSLILAIALLAQPDTLPHADEGGVTIRSLWGEPAKDLQRRLAEGGYYSAGVDGIVGPKTVDALEWLQRCNGIEPSGRIGFSTAQFLGIELAAVYDPDGFDERDRNDVVGRMPPRPPPTPRTGTHPIAENAFPVGDSGRTSDAGLLPSTTVRSDDCAERQAVERPN